MTETRYTFNKDEVTKLKIFSTLYPTTIQEVEGLDEVVITVNGEDERFPYKCEMEEGKVKLKFKDKTVQIKRNEFKEYEQMGAFVHVDLPRNMNLEKVDFEMAAGSCKIDLPTLVTGKSDVKSGAGDIQVYSLHTTEKASFEIGAGTARIHSFTSDDNCSTTIQCGVGDLNMEADGLGNYDISCGVGNVTIQLGAPETYYNYKMSCGLGNISLNGSRQGRFLGSHTEVASPDATHILNASCGLGNLKIITA